MCLMGQKGGLWRQKEQPQTGGGGAAGGVLTFSRTRAPLSSPPMMRRFWSREHGTSAWSSPLLKTPVTLCRRQSCFMEEQLRRSICRSYLQEGSSQRTRSVLADMNQDPPGCIHGNRWIRLLGWNTWTLTGYYWLPLFHLNTSSSLFLLNPNPAEDVAGS